MKYFFTFLFALLMSVTVFAQNISVASFEMLQNDLTANTQGTMVYDQNGEKCALIKVETTQTGFTFDAGSLGVVKTEQHTAEVWVYVPAGVKRLSIAHQQLGRLNEYDLGMSLQKAKTYRLTLTTGTVTTVVQEAVTSQFLVFKVSPADATVLVNDESWRVNEGSARKYVPFVWEWCMDIYGSYNGGSQDNPSGAASGSFRVCRGGSFGVIDKNCRVANRNYLFPDYRGSNVGLRLAL